MNIFTALLAGLVFGAGLTLSGMVDPAKIIGFLDLAGNWDPSLALVMAGAVSVGSIAFAVAGKSRRTLLGAPLHLPPRAALRQIDRRLVLGSMTFGIGWGLAGYCPGPALASLVSGSAKPWIFVTAMLAGMAVFELAERRTAAGAGLSEQ